MKRLLGGVGGLLLIANLLNAQALNTLDTQQLERIASVSNKVNLNTNLPIVAGQEGDDQEQVRSKKFSKVYSADKGDKIVLSNQYGSMQIRAWDRKEIKVDAEISAIGGSDSESQKLLDEVSIESGKSGNQIVFKTIMGLNNKSWGRGSRNGKRWVREVRVNYVVYLPATNDLTLSQTYGSVAMGELSGSLYAKVQYGDFSAISLNSTNNYISVQYGKASISSLNRAVIVQQYGSGLTIGTIRTLDLDVQYASVNIGTIKGNAKIKQQYGDGLVIGTAGGDLDLDVQYANVNVKEIRGNARIKQQYSNLVVGSAEKIDVNAEYTNANVGTLKGDGNFSMSYNNLVIGEVTNDCKLVTIKGDYLGVSVGFSNTFNAELKVNTNYAGFKYGDRVSVRAEGDGSNKSYTGKIGSGSNSVSVKINADYGSVRIK